MKEKTIVVNGVSITCYDDGSVEKVDGRTGEIVRQFGSNAHGYRAITLNGQKFLIHRIIAQAFLDDFDDRLQVDHINGMRSANHVSNLRMVTKSENAQAYSDRNDGKSKFRGVSRLDGRWRATCASNGKHQYLGSFDEEIDAAMAFDRYAKSVGYPKEGLNFHGRAISEKDFE